MNFIPFKARFSRPLWPELDSEGPNNRPALISVADFCEKYHYAKSTVYEWIRSKQIKAIKRGGRYLVYPDTCPHWPLGG